jgi:hypothetical protein
MLNSKLRRLAALAAVTAGLTAPASPASADLPNREVVAASAHTVDDRGEAVVECPPGTRVVGAGADIAGIPAGSGSVILDDLIPTVDSVTAYAYEAEHGTNADWQISAWAVCGSPHGSSVTSSRASVRNSRDVKDVDVTCPPGKVVLGTGASIDGARGEVVIDEIVPTTRTVTAKGVEAPAGGGFAGDWEIRVYAICAEEPGGRVIEGRTTPESSQDKPGNAPCDDGKAVFGGGFDINGGAGETFIDDFIPANVAGTNTGVVRTFAMENWDGSDGNGRDWSLTTYAICGTA